MDTFEILYELKRDLPIPLIDNLKDSISNMMSTYEFKISSLSRELAGVKIQLENRSNMTEFQGVDPDIVLRCERENHQLSKELLHLTKKYDSDTDLLKIQVNTNKGYVEDLISEIDKLEIKLKNKSKKIKKLKGRLKCTQSV